MEDKNALKVLSLLEKNKLGMSITDLVRESGLSRSSIRTSLAKLEGAKLVKIRQVGMAKLYSLSRRKR